MEVDDRLTGTGIVMDVVIYTHSEFERQFKRFRKKYHSMVNDYRDFIDSIMKKPFQGSSLGGGVRKVRFGVASLFLI